MRQGPTPRRVRELSKLFDADRRTIARWQFFWREHFPKTPFWRVESARFVTVTIERLPRLLLEAFIHNDEDREDWKRLLCFLSPITIPGGLEIKIRR
jgi:hypothetical protein